MINANFESNKKSKLCKFTKKNTQRCEYYVNDSVLFLKLKETSIINKSLLNIHPADLDCKQFEKT